MGHLCVLRPLWFLSTVLFSFNAEVLHTFCQIYLNIFFLAVIESGIDFLSV